MSITIKEDIKQDQIERLHSFSLKRSSVVSSKNKSEQEKLNNILKSNYEYFWWEDLIKFNEYYSFILEQSNHGTEKQTLSLKLKAWYIQEKIHCKNEFNINQ